MRSLDSRSSIKSAAGTAAIVACLVVTAGQLTAAPRPDRSSNQDLLGNPTRVETALDASSSAAVLAQAGKTRDALGFPVGVKRAGKHVQNGFEQAEYDEVSETDSAGRVTSLTQFDMNRRLRAAVRLDSPPREGPKVTRDVAIHAAQRSALAAGLTVGVPSTTDADEATGGWTVHWARVKDGVRVRGDETRIHVWPDGRIQSVARVEHDLAVAPSQRIGLAGATRVAVGNLDRWFANRSSGYAIQDVALQWVEPNGAFDPSRITSTPAPYRLAWVADVKPSGEASNYMWLMSLFVDAADGTIIGGDFVE
ncbi:MAG: hypothetical protein ABSD62_00015 [Candidatus Limnocylindrales bacterium]|jgi:hypothetical protein